jgi:hypothetical protein
VGTTGPAVSAEYLCMTAAETRLPTDTELERVQQWRAEELRRAGYGREGASDLAERLDVDLHRAIELLEQGCSEELALAILL